MPLRTLRRLVHGLIAAALLTLPARATWSIVVVNTETGEVCVAAATCLENFNLIKDLPVVRVKEGGGVAQGQIDLGAIHRTIMWDGLMAGDSAKKIMDTVLSDGNGVKLRQFGVVSFKSGNSETYSGPFLGKAFDGLTGKDGPLKFAIQGNVITGTPVIEAARDALVGTEGDLTTKVMAAMHAAREMGGDGRCSCPEAEPFSCGAPPPEFEKSAHCAFLVSSRQGDVDGADCYWGLGCAIGEYYVRLHVTGDWDDVDPVIELQQEYDAWRANLIGRADHLNSTWSMDSDVVMADGATSTELFLQLVDVEGTPLTTGGATITVEPEDGGDPLVAATEVLDHGDGTYTVRLTAAATPGEQELLVRVDDGEVTATLYPFPTITVEPFTDLWVGGASTISASAGGDIPLVANFGVEASGHPYLLLASGSGSVPGVDLGDVVLPLNVDGVLMTTLEHAGEASLPGTIGALDENGRGEGALVASPGLLGPLVGFEMTWAALDYAGPFAATSSATLTVAP